MVDLHISRPYKENLDIKFNFLARVLITNKLKIDLSIGRPPTINLKNFLKTLADTQVQGQGSQARERVQCGPRTSEKMRIFKETKSFCI